MNALTSELIRLHGREGLRAEQWFDLMIDDVLAGFGLRLAPEDIPSEPVRAASFELSGLYAKNPELMSMAVVRGQDVDIAGLKSGAEESNPEDAARLKELDRTHYLEQGHRP